MAKIAIALTIALTTSLQLNAQAVRVRVSNVCGSGSIAGYDEQGAYVLTNAHVSGTQIGRQVQIDYDTANGRVTLPARIVMAAYSNRTMTDWAILKVETLKSGAKWQLSTTLPTERTHQTCGSPRCVWPLVCSQVTTTTISGNQSLWKFREISIGGQSGSSVRDKSGKTKGLITWRIGNEGASQTTSQIYRQSTQQTTEADIRPTGLIELVTPRSETQSGFFTEQSIETSIATLPIWDVEQEQPPTPPCSCCPKNEPEMSEIEKTLVETIRKEKLDIDRLLKLILELITLFRR